MQITYKIRSIDTESNYFICIVQTNAQRNITLQHSVAQGMKYILDRVENQFKKIIMWVLMDRCYNW